MNFRFLAYIAVGITILSGCSQPNDVAPNSIGITKSVDDVTAAKIYNSTIKPKTQLDLLKNLKTIIDNNLLLREDFYTAENINKFLSYGGRNIACYKSMSDKKICSTAEEKDYSKEIYVDNGFPIDEKIDIFFKTPYKITFEEAISIFGDKFLVCNHNYPSQSNLEDDNILFESRPSPCRYLYRKSVDEPILLAQMDLNKRASISFGFSDVYKSYYTKMIFYISHKKLITGVSVDTKIIDGVSK